MGKFQGVVMPGLQSRRKSDMMQLEEAIAVIRDGISILGTEEVPLGECVNRVLREDVISDIDMPPFDKAAVDGYACRRQDIRNPLTVVETILAGAVPRQQIGPNQCAKIMTGAVIPPGVDCVLLREETDEQANSQIRFKRESTATNICFKGEDVHAGQKLLTAGTRISPSTIATLALAGMASPRVSKKPGVAVIATGDEIVEPAVKPGPSKIRNSNSYQLLAHAAQFGCTTSYYGIVGDTNEAILAVIAKARAENDVLLITGGVSAGDLDLVPALLEQSGYRIFIRGVGIQPGRPTIFGRSEKGYVFGIPGSPVASFIVFELLVKELLAGMMELHYRPQTMHCPLAGNVRRQKTNRIGLRPVRIDTDGSAVPVEYHGTAHISSYAQADGIVGLPVGTAELTKGTIVEVRAFRDL